ncbi:hypothetical protein [Nocardia sp. NPDC006630]|uniref:hypothetical protein n=1 Tax=Nocardia sp. NPDC006630 TaxID=3157181 RepID=UPI00339FB3FC
MSDTTISELGGVTHATVTDWDRAPGVLEGARTVTITPREAGLDYWIRDVVGGTWKGLVNGHTAGAVSGPHMHADTPFRQALFEEFAFRSVAEDKATRALAPLVAKAPDRVTMEFYATQLVDEARHAAAFRSHLVELGAPAEGLDAVIAEVAGPHIASVLDPLERFGLDVIDGNLGFELGVLVLTVLVEGVLAPTAELSERKWHVIDPQAAQIERGASIDEIRHLAVGSEVVRDFLAVHPQHRGAALEVLDTGLTLWKALPMSGVLLHRELLFQQGLTEFADVVGDYEIWPGRRLVDTTPEERLMTAEQWSHETQTVRLEYMGLGGVL